MIISVASALNELKKSNLLFVEFFKHGSLSIELYKPDTIDHQQPHEKDELYIIVEGSGQFFCGGKRNFFSKGDMLFVPAGEEHRFEDFTSDFSTWVVFYGPRGGGK